MKSRFYQALRLLSAFLLAAGAARFVSHYDLIAFSGAGLLSFVFIFFGALFLSKKYEPGMHFIFLSIALILAYKAAGLKKHRPTFAANEKNLNRLFVAASLLKSDKIITGHYPPNLKELTKFASDASFALDYCLRDCPWPVPFESGAQDGFWLRIRSKNSRDKAPTLWYINEDFDVYFGSESQSDFERYPLEKV